MRPLSAVVGTPRGGLGRVPAGRAAAPLIMVIGDLDLGGVPVTPLEADPPLIVDPDAVLPPRPPATSSRLLPVGPRRQLPPPLAYATLPLTSIPPPASPPPTPTPCPHGP